MSTTSQESKPPPSAVFPVGAFGDREKAGFRSALLEEYLLGSGTPVVHARPKDEEPTARVVLSPSLRGHNAMFGELCLRLAQRLAWEVIAPEPFPGRQQLSEPERIAFCETRDDRPVLDDLTAAADRLGSHPVALIGFCMGGMYAIKASAGSRFSAAVAFYGFVRLPPGWRQEHREEPIACAGRRVIPLLGVFGAKDPFITAGDIAEFKATGAEAIVFPEAGHGFAHDPLLPSYRAADGRAAWTLATAFVESALGRARADGTAAGR